MLSAAVVVARRSNGAAGVDDAAANHLADGSLDRQRLAGQRALVEDRRLALDHAVDWHHLAGFTSSRSPGRTSSSAGSVTVAADVAVDSLGARSSRERSSRRALPAARLSSTRPLASITVITAPARYSPITSVPSSASNAIRSTPNLRRRSASNTRRAAGATPAVVVIAHTS